MLTSRKITLAGIVVMLDNATAIPVEEKWQHLIDAMAGATIVIDGKTITWIEPNLYRVTQHSASA